MSLQQREAGKRTTAEYFRWLLLLLLTHAALALPVALLINRPVDYNYDEQGWHYPNVLLLAEKWPALDWQHDMLSEIAPGYLYFLAGISQITGSDIHTLRVINILTSLVLLALLFASCVRTVKPRLACLLLLPLATSNYFIKTSAFLYTDNAGLLLVAAALLLTTRAKLTTLNSASAGVLAMCATLSRQVHFWVVGPLLWRALEPLVVALSARFLPENYQNTDKQASLASVSRSSIFHAVVMVALPVAALVFLILQWGGIVREPWRSEIMTVSTAAWAYLLALMAVFAPFFLMPVTGMKNLLQQHSTKWAMLAGTAFGLCTAVAYPNAYNEDAGHSGGVLWQVAAQLPVLAERSLLFLLLAPVGGALLALTLCWLHRQRGYLISLRWLIWVCAFASTYGVQTYVYQRYFEAPLLMFLMLALAFGLDEKNHKPLAASLGALTLLQLALTLGGFYPLLPW